MIRSALAALAIALAALAACGDSRKPAPRPAAAPAAAVVAAAAAPQGADAGAEAPAPPEWVYSSVGKRDPFRSFLTDLEAAGQALVTRCNTPLGRFELEQLKLVAVVTGLADPVAMLEAPSGVGYAVRRGACLGKNGGVVAAIRTGEVVVSEWAIKADGTRDKTQTVLRLPKEPSLNLEE
jgi:type IV pilus assembly protein PilP